MARWIVFPHRYSFSQPAGGIRRPKVPVRLFHIADREQYMDLNMLVDSGADTSCLPLDLAADLGIDTATLAATTSRGVGGAISTYRHAGLEMAIAGTTFVAPVHFVPGLNAFLLGRAVVFDHFIFAFEQRKGEVYVRVSARSR